MRLRQKSGCRLQSADRARSKVRMCRVRASLAKKLASQELTLMVVGSGSTPEVGPPLINAIPQGTSSSIEHFVLPLQLPSSGSPGTVQSRLLLLRARAHQHASVGP